MYKVASINRSAFKILTRPVGYNLRMYSKTFSEGVRPLGIPTNNNSSSDNTTQNNKGTTTSIEDAGAVGESNAAKDETKSQIHNETAISLDEKAEIKPNTTGDNANIEEHDEGEDAYLTTIFEKMEPYMDTYDVYRQLKTSGFTESQAEEIINLLIVQLNSKLLKLPSKYSEVYELENEKYLYESAQQELRVDVTRNREKNINECISLINDLERDFNNIQDELNNDLLQLKNNNQVTINDEKQENTLMSKKLFLKIQESNHKITTELIGNMRSEIESLRWHMSRWGIMSILVAIFSASTTFYIFKKRTMDNGSHPGQFVPLVVYEPSEFDEDDYHTDLDESVIN